MKKAITYEAPELMVFEIHTVGTLCQSVNGVTVQDLEYDEDQLGC